MMKIKIKVKIGIYDIMYELKKKIEVLKKKL